MDETRALARLPHMDIEIVRRELPEERAEEFSIRLRASPSFEQFAAYLDARPMFWPWLAFSPILAWQQATRAFLAPRLPPARALEDRGDDAPERRADDTVHPFPGPREG